MFETNPIFVKDLLRDAGTGAIQLPDFQRGWIWDDERICGLLASISRGFPVGAIMTLSAGGEVRFAPRAIEGVDCAKDIEPQQYLLDGQQRITSLFQTLSYHGPVATQDAHNRRIDRYYYIDMVGALDQDIDREDAVVSVPINRIVTREFGREIELDLSTREREFESHMIPTESLLDGLGWMMDYNKHWSGRDSEHPYGDVATFVQTFSKVVLEAFGTYQVPVIKLRKGTPKEAICKVFEKVNTGGVALNVFELVTAQFAVDDFRLRSDWDARKLRMRDAFGVLSGIEGEHFLQAVALMSTYDRRKMAVRKGRSGRSLPAVSCKKDAILNLELNEYRRWCDAVEAGFFSAAKFLHGQHVFRHKDVPYTTQLVPMAAIFAELGAVAESGHAIEKIERWFWCGIFGEVYAGNTETQFALDVQQVVEFVNEDKEPLLVNQANFIPERLVTLRSRNSAAYKGLYALQMKSGAADWRSGELLTIAQWHASNIDIHHIFPAGLVQEDCQCNPEGHL